mgnify:FL=1
MRAVFLDYQTFSQSLDLSTINQVVSNLNLHATTSPSQVVQHSANAEIILTNKVELSRETLSQLPD